MKIDALKVAKFYATVKHAGQLYSGVPYTHHLAAVEAVLRRFGPIGLGTHSTPLPPIGDIDGTGAEIMLVAAWLHDIVEDTGTKLKDIVEMFGPDVAELVGAVTDEKAENRKLRKLLTYPKIRSAGRYAVRLKLADRIANIEHGGLNSMYQKEHEDFRRALFTPGENEDMWTYLDKLVKGECLDHWHCDPDLAAHTCDRPKREEACPTCREEPVRCGICSHTYEKCDCAKTGRR